jgi:RNA polymerase sigma factor (sigma-70 family)
MTEPKDGSWPPHSSAEAEQAELYETLSVYLRDLLTRAFELPERDAEWLVRETFTDYGLNKPAPDARAWLKAVVCREANGYRQRRGLPPANEAEVERHAANLPIRDALERLSTRARKALQLKHEAKKSYAEVAAELGIPEHAAERVVARALAKLRGLLRGGETRQP